jgi:hypothetical protein
MKKRRFDNSDHKKDGLDRFFMDAIIDNSMKNAMRLTELIIENRVREGTKIENDTDVINIYSNAFGVVMYVMYDSMRE